MGKKEIKLNSEKVNKREQKIKALKLGLLISALFLMIIYVILRIIYEQGGFTVSLDQNFAKKSGIIMYENPETDIKSMNLEELKSYMESIGEKAFRAKQLYQWMHQKQASSFDEMTNLSKSLQEKLKNECHFVSLKQEAVQISKLDGTRKYLFLSCS